MNDKSITTSRVSPENQPTVPIKRRLTIRLLQVFALLLAGVVSYFWIALSGRVLIRFDRTGLELGEPGFRLPIAYTETLLRCLGPVGWIVGLGIFGLAFIMVLTVYRWPWPLQAILAAAPIVLVMYQITSQWDIRPCVQPVLLQIVAAEMALAVLAAVLCRPIVKRLLQWVAPKQS